MQTPWWSVLSLWASIMLGLLILYVSLGCAWLLWLLQFFLPLFHKIPWTSPMLGKRTILMTYHELDFHIWILTYSLIFFVSFWDMAQSGLKLTLYVRRSLILWSSWLQFPSPEITGMYPHAQCLYSAGNTTGVLCLLHSPESASFLASKCIVQEYLWIVTVLEYHKH